LGRYCVGFIELAAVFTDAFIHRSYIASIKQITKIEKRSIWINETELPIGAAYTNGVEKVFK